MTDLTRQELAALARQIAATAPEEIDCASVLDRVAAYVEQAANGSGLSEELQLVRQHLAVCPACLEEYEALLLAVGGIDREMTEAQRIEAFLAGDRFAVVGASRDRAKYGNKVLRAYGQNDRDVVAVNPTVDAVEGVPAYASLSELPHAVHGVSIITPPPVTVGVVDEAIRLGIRHFWLQPGAEDEDAVARARAAGVNVISGGACVLVVMGFREDA